MKVNWGTKLLISLIIFAGIMATMVTIAMRENIDLVDKNYYQQEIAYQDRIDRLNNNLEDNALVVNLDGQTSNILLNFNEKVENGIIHLFRPSNASEDKKIALKTNEQGMQSIPYSELIPGLWRIKVEWSLGENDYYSEKILNIP